ncbi:MAG: YqcI/YcgG family protein [Bdellovibrionaceae bacterium]|nr:YqcI/YcgG family protein [Bdellovibrio sp.]
MKALKNEIVLKINNLLTQKNYPCVAALKSFYSNDYELGVYEGFGTTTSSLSLANDLVKFAERYDETQSLFYSFFAVFPEAKDMSDQEFETSLWQELSGLALCPEFSPTWDPHFSSNPADKNFCFSLNGRAYFVVGLHKNSVRLSRQFEYPTLIFNLYEQFRQLEKSEQFQPMVALNRKRDEKFQGVPNPMVVAHGNDWEAIQFSGRENSDDWKCPFSKLLYFFAPEVRSS